MSGIKPLPIEMQDLIEEQQHVLSEMIRAIQDYEDDPKDQRNRVVAILGSRGWGKTTILEKLKQTMDASGRFKTTSLIDASVIVDGMGLMPTCIQALWDQIEEMPLDSPGYREKDARTNLLKAQARKTEEHDDLKKSFLKVFTHTLSCEESHRDLAREMAMSPQQYNNIVQTWASDRKFLKNHFHQFTEMLADAFQKSKGHDTQEIKLVIFIDDLDLAPPEVARKWAHCMIADFQCVNVLWVLAFDRNRLVGSMSAEDPVSGKKDLNTGNALLTKVVGYDKQFQLNAWSYNRRTEFRPIGYPKTSSNLGKLLADLKKLQLLPLLPNNPRALESIYFWLELKEKEELTHDAFFGKLVEVNNAEMIASQFQMISAAQLATTFRWEEGIFISEPDWDSILNSVRSEEPLWGMPVPKALQGLVHNKVPEAFLEVFCDIGLNAKMFSPYQLLLRMPFTRERLEKCKLTREFNDYTIEDYFIECKNQIGCHFYWQKWTSASENEHVWHMELGAPGFLEALLGFRNPQPVKMVHELYLSHELLDPKHTGDVSEKLKDQEFLPKNLRSLLLFLDALEQAPWVELALVRKFWGPLAFTQIVAAFHLVALINAIWPTVELPSEFEPKQSLLYFPLNPFSLIKKMDEYEIDDNFKKLKLSLTNLEYQSDPNLLHEARSELFTMLGRLLDHPAIKELSLSNKETEEIESV